MKVSTSGCSTFLVQRDPASLLGRVLFSVWVKFLLGMKTFFFMSYQWYAQGLGQEEPHPQQKKRPPAPDRGKAAPRAVTQRHAQSPRVTSGPSVFTATCLRRDLRKVRRQTLQTRSHSYPAQFCHPGMWRFIKPHQQHFRRDGLPLSLCFVHSRSATLGFACI